MDERLKARLQQAGRDRIVVSHAVGAANDGRYALIKLVLFGGTTELHVLPAGLAYWLLDQLARAMAAGAITDRRSGAEPGSPEAQQIALYAAARPEIVDADWYHAAQQIVAEIRAHAFGTALVLVSIASGTEATLILPDQVAILLHESLALATTYLIDRVCPPQSRSEY